MGSKVRFFYLKKAFLLAVLTMSILFTTGFKDVSALSSTEEVLGNLINKYGEENVIVGNGLSLKLGETYSLNNESFAIAAQGEIKWSSLNNSIANISNGNVKAISLGNTFIVGQAGSKYWITEVWVDSQETKIKRGIQSVTSGKPTYKVFIDPGHGGKDPGAVQNGVKEATINLSTALKIEAKLKAKGVEVMMSRYTDVFVELKERAAMANRYGADVFVSMHYNSADATSARGIETYYHNKKPNHYTFASKVQNELINKTGANNRGVRTADYVVIRESNMQAILVEGGFLTNVNEAALVSTDSYQDKIANGIVDGIMSYLSETIPTYTWQFENNKWYYINKATGEKATGWINYLDQWYYLDETGARVTGLVTIGGKQYYFEPLGVRYSGWLSLDNKTYYFNENGEKTTGWIYFNSKWYYVDNTDTMRTGWIFLNGRKYFLDQHGVMKTGWILHGNNKYYLNENGEMQTGWLNFQGNWYYLHGSGVMKTGWLLDVNTNTWYYLYPDGKMASNTVINGYRLSSSGALVK